MRPPTNIYSYFPLPPPSNFPLIHFLLTFHTLLIYLLLILIVCTQVPPNDARDKGNAGLSIELSRDMIADHGLDRYDGGGLTLAHTLAHTLALILKLAIILTLALTLKSNTPTTQHSNMGNGRYRGGLESALETRKELK